MDVVNLKAWILLICVRQVLKFRKIKNLPGPLIGFVETEPTCILLDILLNVFLNVKKKTWPIQCNYKDKILHIQGKPV